MSGNESESGNSIFVGEGIPSPIGNPPTDPLLPPTPEEVVQSLRQLQDGENDEIHEGDSIESRIRTIVKRNEENYQKLIALLFLNSENGEEALFSRPQVTSSTEQLHSQGLSVYTGLYDLVGEKIDTVGQLIECIHPDDQERIITELMVPQSATLQKNRQFEFRLRKKFPDRDTDGKIIFSEDGEIQYSKPPEWRYVRYIEKPYTTSDGESQQWVGKLTDISEMADRMFHDQLTGVNNLRYFETFVRSKVMEMLQGDRNFALLMIDVNKLKPPNDYLGHTVGDQMILETVRIIKECTRESDIICRVGGDEFVVLLDRVSSEDNLDDILQRLASAFNQNQEYIPAEITQSPDNSEIISAWLGSGSIDVDRAQNQPEENTLMPVGAKVRIRPMVSIGACFVPQIPHPETDSSFEGDPLKYLENEADMAMYEIKNLRSRGTHYALAVHEQKVTDDKNKKITNHVIELS